MKNVKNLLGLFFISTLMFISCDTLDLDLTENPNALSPNQADAGFFLNSIQINFAFWVNSMGDRGGELTRINYMNGRTYNNVYSPDSWNDYGHQHIEGCLKIFVL